MSSAQPLLMSEELERDLPSPVPVRLFRINLSSAYCRNLAELRLQRVNSRGECTLTVTLIAVAGFIEFWQPDRGGGRHGSCKPAIRRSRLPGPGTPAVTVSVACPGPGERDFAPLVVACQ